MLPGSEECNISQIMDNAVFKPLAIIFKRNSFELFIYPRYILKVYQKLLNSFETSGYTKVIRIPSLTIVCIAFKESV